MYYPESFKKRVKETYPEYYELHRKLDDGEEGVGKYLYDGSYPASISIDTVLNATSLEELKEKANELQTKLKLYGQWCELKNQQGFRQSLKYNG